MNSNNTLAGSSKRQASKTPASNRPSTYNKLSYIQKIARINRKLRVGDISDVAQSTDYSNTHVSDTLSGKYMNESIVNRAYVYTRGRISNANKLARTKLRTS